MNRLMSFRPALLAGLLLFSNSGRAELPDWIWSSAKPGETEVCYFRKVFNVDGAMTHAQLTATADNDLTVFINGHQVLQHDNWNTVVKKDVADQLEPGKNVIAIQARNQGGDAAVLAMLELTPSRREKGKQIIVTDSSWRYSAAGGDKWKEADFADGSWSPAVSRGKVGVAPWGDVMKLPTATAAESLTLLPGFKAELIRSAEPGEGSWVSMTIDPKGRLIVSPQEGRGNILRFSLSSHGQVEKVEKINLPVGSAMGLLYAYDSLYVNGAGPKGLGLYRLQDVNHDGIYDTVTLIKLIEGAGGEHGSHAVVLGKDRHLYIVNGNFTKIPKDIAADSQHKNYAEDQLLPRGNDGNGFGNDILPPGGSLFRISSDGSKWQLFSSGMRNTYDFAINPDGEIFGFDSDMEWDWGMPWYRPIRICHLTSGSDFGFREGTGKWPKYYPDSVPSVVDVGIGCPTGMKFGTDSKFPPKYRRALYALDWSYGRILAVHLTPNGASYDATFEPFVKGKPLNLTDIEFGQDGAMYFITGGRGTQSGLYRVSYTGERVREPAMTAQERDAAKARALRHKLEAFHGHVNRRAVDFAWPHLDSPDRAIRYAARIAIESQPVAQWKDRALAESRTNAGINALLALARLGGRETQNDLLKALAKFPLDGLTEAQQLEKLRVIELSFIRQGRPEPALAQMAIEKLDRHYPARSEALNRELSQLLIYLQAPDVVPKTLALLDAAPTLEEQIHYVFHLRNLTNGWTLEQRAHYLSWFAAHRPGEPGEPVEWPGRAYTPWTRKDADAPEHSAETLNWFQDAGRDYADGASFNRFMSNFRKEAINSLPSSDRAELQAFLTDKPVPAKAIATNDHKFVKEWKMNDLQPLLDQIGKGRSFVKGRNAFLVGQCVQCHRFGNEGGAVGPDLTAVSSRYTPRDILESILEPSKVLSEQYQNIIFTKKDGDDVTGRIAEETPEKVVVVTNPLTQTKVELLKKDIAKREPSKISPMPAGLADIFSQEEILDLIAYLETSGNRNAQAFRR